MMSKSAVAASVAPAAYQWPGYTAVFPAKGPLVGHKYAAVPDDEVAAATGEDGWAIALEDGAVLLADPWAEANPDWVIPGTAEPDERPEPPPVEETPDPVPLLSLWNTNPALALVSNADIGKFADGDQVTVAGVQAPYDFANGKHAIANVGVGGDQFELVGVDLTAAGTTIGDAGMTVTPAAPPAGRASRAPEREPERNSNRRTTRR
jgi:hypothetical protein